MGKTNEDKMEQIVRRPYRCKICKQTHMIELNRKMLEGREKFPFPHVFLHDHLEGTEFKEILTILYIDKNLQIRHSEIQETDGNQLFSKEQVDAITKPLLIEIQILREEMKRLINENNSLKDQKGMLF